MTFEDELRAKGYCQSSPGVWSKSLCDRNPRSIAKLERNFGDGTLGTPQVQNGRIGRVLIRITSRRKRLLDEDNLCEKYHVDCLRYAGVLQSDAPGQAKIEVCQEKVGKGEPEFVRIEITVLDRV